MKRHPMVSRIDEARGNHLPPFASAPNADELEILACMLVDDYWSEYALLTGDVPEAAFAIVCEQLEARRQRLKLAVSHPVTTDAAMVRDAVSSRDERKPSRTRVA